MPLVQLVSKNCMPGYYTHTAGTATLTPSSQKKFPGRDSSRPGNVYKKLVRKFVGTPSPVPFFDDQSLFN